MRITKPEFVNYLAETADITKGDASYMYDQFVTTMIELLGKGNDITFVGLGSFKIKTFQQRNGTHPLTHEPFIIPAHKRVTFKEGKDLKELMGEIEVED